MPNPTVIELIAITLAAGQIVDTWKNASFLSQRRSLAEARADLFENGHRRYWWAAVVSCWYCFSHWTPFLILIWLAAGSLALPASRSWFMLPVYSLAMTRAGLLINGLLPKSLRYSRPV